MTVTRDHLMHIVRETHGSLVRTDLITLCGRGFTVGAHELGTYPPMLLVPLCKGCQAIVASAIISGKSLWDAANDWYHPSGSVVPEEDK